MHCSDESCSLEVHHDYLAQRNLFFCCCCRFCTECKSKVLRAYSILVGDLDGPSEKG